MRFEEWLEQVEYCIKRYKASPKRLVDQWMLVSFIAGLSYGVMDNLSEHN